MSRWCGWKRSACRVHPLPLLEFLAPLLQQLVLRQQHVLNALLVALNAGLALRLRPHGLLQVLRLLERRLAPLQFRVFVRLGNAQQLCEVGAPLACSVCKCVCAVHQPTTCVSGGPAKHTGRHGHGHATHPAPASWR